MNQKPDLIIRGGTVIDGSGKPKIEADVSISNGRIIAVGPVKETGSEEINAHGRLVIPGFVDVHTHYDAQVTWANQIMPSSCNGVTTVLMGNCGVGFAPVRKEHRDMLISLMEGVEDIPEAVMRAGLPWSWSSFREYLDTLLSHGQLPLITLPTRITPTSATLIDHISTSHRADYYDTGIIHSSLSDHLPVFYIQHLKNDHITPPLIKQDRHCLNQGEATSLCKVAELCRVYAAKCLF